MNTSKELIFRNANPASSALLKESGPMEKEAGPLPKGAGLLKVESPGLPMESATLLKESAGLRKDYKGLYSITPFTMLDFPEKTACIFWFAGCNMRCLYCYNPEIVQGKGKISYGRALDFLASRKNLLDGVVLSGGESTLPREIIPFASAIRAAGFQIKLDTNGGRPEVLKELIDKGLLAYVALDFKAPEDKFYQITKAHLFSAFEESLDILLAARLPFEVRTTVHSALLDYADINRMISYLVERGYSETYYLQQFQGHVPNLGDLNQASEQLNESLLHKHIKVELRN